MQQEEAHRAKPYVGRFAPSPTGPLHAGSLVAALASWLDAAAHQGQWWVRIEDVDQTRCKPEFAQHILAQLATHGLLSSAPVQWQSKRLHRYEKALDQLQTQGQVYRCACSRRQLQAFQEVRAGALPLAATPARHEELVYPGFCKAHPPPSAARVAWRFDLQAQPPQNSLARNTTPTSVPWQDRRLGEQCQDVAQAVGDFVIKRADGLFAYQLAVVVDDADQGVTHVVRGQDLADNTPRQMVLQGALGLPTPIYLHTPLVLGHNQEKLSKQNGATALPQATPVTNLQQAAHHLGLAQASANATVGQCLHQWAEQWRDLYPLTMAPTHEFTPRTPPDHS